MPLRGNRKTLRNFSYKPVGKKALKAHIGLKLDQDVKEKLRTIPNWPDKLRKAIAELIQVHEGES